jgi:hypothetical protein
VVFARVGVLVLVVALVGAGCADDTAEGVENTTSTVEQTTITSEPTATTPVDIWPGDRQALETDLAEQWWIEGDPSYPDARCPGVLSTGLVTCFVDVPMATETFVYDVLLHPDGTWTLGKWEAASAIEDYAIPPNTDQPDPPDYGPDSPEPYGP